MLKIVLMLAVTALCQADLPENPPQVLCGYMPSTILECIGNPSVVTKHLAVLCTPETSECGRMKCIFKMAAWKNGDTIDKKMLTAYFDQFAKEHPAWTQAVNQAKASCFGESLPAQGAYLSCPEFDIMHCVLTAFIRSAQPSQWSTSEDCKLPRQYAAQCPICPQSCFAPAIPFGTCNACTQLPVTL